MMNKKDNSGTGEKYKSKEFIDSSDDSSDDDDKEEKKKSKSSSSKKDSTEQTKKDKAKSESESDGSDSDAEEVCNFKMFIYNICLLMCLSCSSCFSLLRMYKFVSFPLCVCHVHCVFHFYECINLFLFHLKLINISCKLTALCLIYR